MFYFSKKGKRIMFSPLLFTGTFTRIWDNLTSVWRQTLKSQERKLSLADIFYAIRIIFKKCHVMNETRYNVFWKTFDVLLRLRRKKTSKSSNMTKVTLHMPFLIINRHSNDSKCAFMLHCAFMSCFCLCNWLHDNIDVFFLIQILTQYF